MIENKRQESEKESKEKTRGGKLLITRPFVKIRNTKGTEFGGQSAGSVHTLGFCIDLEGKGLVEKGFVST